MLSNGFDTTLHLKLSPSKILFAIRLVSHLLALLAISFPLDLNINIKIAVYVFIFSSLTITVINYIKTKDRQKIYRWQKSNQWIESAGEDDVVWTCLNGAMITSWFLIVTLENANKKQPIFIGADQCSRDTYRRLRVRLKYLSSPDQSVDAKSMDSR